MTDNKIIVMLVFLLMLSCISYGQILAPEVDMKSDFGKDCIKQRNLESQLADKKLGSLSSYEAGVQELADKWKGNNKENYARIIASFYAFGPYLKAKGKEIRNIARQKAHAVFDMSETISLETELKLAGLVSICTFAENAPSGSEWEDARKKDAELHLRVLNRLVSSHEPGWLKFCGIHPTPNALAIEFGFPCYTDPKDVTDEKLREAYSKALDELYKKMNKIKEQRLIELWMKMYPRFVESYLIELYSKKPYSNNELSELMEKYKTESATRQRIIDGISAQINLAK